LSYFVPIVFKKSNGQKPSLSHLLIREVPKVDLTFESSFHPLPLIYHQTFNILPIPLSNWENFTTFDWSIAMLVQFVLISFQCFPCSEFLIATQIQMWPHKIHHIYTLFWPQLLDSISGWKQLGEKTRGSFKISTFKLWEIAKFG